MMQIEQLALYSKRGQIRTVDFKLGSLNVVTGDSGTGKSALINIFRYCFGSGNPDVPLGPISASVGWYGLLVRVGERRLFLGRPAPVEGADEVSAAMLLIEPEGLPEFESLEPNSTRSELRAYLTTAMGIEENLHVPSIGQTRQALAATFVHSLYYCFQSQGEMANPEVLFHRQNREWQAQTIRDTLPYFLGAQGLDDLRRRQRLTAQRRALRVAEQRLNRAQTELLEGHDRATSLLVEAYDAGLIASSEVQDDSSLAEVRAALEQTVDAIPSEAVTTREGGEEFDRVRLALAEVRDRVREIGSELQGLQDYADVAAAYEEEVGEQRARLVSIGLVSETIEDADCPVCGGSIAAGEDGDSHNRLSVELQQVSRRLRHAERERPRVERARDELFVERAVAQDRVRELTSTLSALADTNELWAQQQHTLNIQSYVRGKLAGYLESVESVEPGDFERLSADVQSLRAAVEALEDQLDPALAQSRVDSAMAKVSRSATAMAVTLGLEHSEQGVRVDPNRLTVVADTAQGPAYLDAGQIGSGFNWVGYHLATYLALQNYFIGHDRPVPRFVLFDQPSQAFFPPDRQGEVEDMNDTDRAHALAFFRLMLDEARRHEGDLQVIVLDHADFDDEWFQDAVVQRWRDGRALIPASWLSAPAPDQG